MRLLKISLLFCVSLLAGCGAPSVEDFKNDPDRLADQIAKCEEMKPSEVRKSEACMNAAQAQMELIKKEMGNMFKGFMQ